MKRIILSTLLLSILHFTAPAQTKNYIDQPYMEVSGYADSLVIPNEIYIKIYISEKDTRDRIPLEETESKMFEGLKSLGLNPEKDLSANDILSNYRFYLLKQKSIMKSKQYILKVGDAVTAGKVFILLESLDISNTSIDRVDHSEREVIKNITRTKAVENAKRNAVSLTRPLNQTVGPAIYLTENENQSSAGNYLEGRLAGISIRGDKFTSEQTSLPKIEFEKIKIATTVSVKFILK